MLTHKQQLEFKGILITYRKNFKKCLIRLMKLSDLAMTKIHLLMLRFSTGKTLKSSETCQQIKKSLFNNKLPMHMQKPRPNGINLPKRDKKKRSGCRRRRMKN